ncbi:acyltransferase [Chitinophaga solisilvae]|uniref:acyltransferase n=1 Tax=Chitinophaga solisilvae TaxID=1233460 RepID=UPI001920BF60|nr:acyltransferase [Chitinophaga solisilvae]
MKVNIGWVDLLRIIACLLVILSHCCDPFVAQFDADRLSFLSGAFTGSLVRPCVPLFAMMTGVLLLPVQTSMADFYRKRIGRIVIPLAFWSMMLPVLFFIYLNYINPASGNPSLLPGDHTLQTSLQKLYTFIFNFNFDTIPLWYLYMLIGLYLIMPVISAWLNTAGRQDIRLFLYIWGITLVLPYIKMAAPLLGYKGNYGNMGLLGICDWNSYGTFYYFSGFIGYLVLAYYLVKYPLTWSRRRMLAICIPMFTAGYLITSLGFVLTQRYFPANYANLEIVWYFAGINVFMMTFPVFVLVQRMNIPASPVLSRLASLTFGIYLCHFVFVQIGYDIFGSMETLPVIVRLLAIAGFSVLVSYLIARIMSASRITRRFVS